jgi:signal transduction histidine kinase
MGRRFFRDLSLKAKLATANAIIAGASLLLVGAVLTIYSAGSYRRALANQLRTQAEIVGMNTTPALVFHDDRAAAEVLGALRAAPRVAIGAVYAADGSLFAKYARQGAEGWPAPSSLAPAEAGGFRFDRDVIALAQRIGPPARPIGSVYIQADLSGLRAQVAQFVGVVAVVLSVSLLAAVALASALHKTIAGPLIDLSRVARTVAADKDFGVRATTLAHDEVGTLVGSFNEMLAEIQKRDADLHRVNQELNRRTQELARKNEEVEAFVYIVSHDLRGPLVNLQGFGKELERSCEAVAKILRDGSPQEVDPRIAQILDAEIPSSLRFISASTTKFERLINALLQLSRSGRQEYGFERLDMRTLAAATVDALRANVDRSGAQIAIGTLPQACGDATAVGQVLSNLVSNAMQYLQPGRPGRIEVGGETDGALNRYWVRDNGVGIPQSARKRLFQVFQRFHQQLSSGEGMGLATVKRIVERHGGAVWADSVEGTGTTFYFTLPAEMPREERTP